MSNESANDSQRWEELQVAELLFGLSPVEQAECDELARDLPAGISNPFESSIAALDLAWSNARPDDLPLHLLRAVRSQAQRELQASQTESLELPRRSRRTAVLLRYVPWLASAVCLLLAVSAWFWNRPAQQAMPNVSEGRAELIASAKDLVVANWSPGTTPIEGSHGDVVWSSNRQLGFMRFVGLPVNLPTIEQYQLWIFDKNQSDKTPIDGGVFDVRSGGEVVVPIHAKLKVHEAFMFAITVEKPGGVVVSDRERLLLLAKVE